METDQTLELWTVGSKFNMVATKEADVVLNKATLNERSKMTDAARLYIILYNVRRGFFLIQASFLPQKIIRSELI